VGRKGISLGLGISFTKNENNKKVLLRVTKATIG